MSSTETLKTFYKFAGLPRELQVMVFAHAAEHEIHDDKPWEKLKEGFLHDIEPRSRWHYVSDLYLALIDCCEWGVYEWFEDRRNILHTSRLARLLALEAWLKDMKGIEIETQEHYEIKKQIKAYTIEGQIAEVKRRVDGESQEVELGLGASDAIASLRSEGVQEGHWRPSSPIEVVWHGTTSLLRRIGVDLAGVLHNTSDDMVDSTMCSAPAQAVQFPSEHLSSEHIHLCQPSHGL